jgi:hypothetical protein
MTTDLICYDNENPKLLESIVCVCDILGFKELIYSHTGSDGNDIIDVEKANLNLNKIYLSLHNSLGHLNFTKFVGTTKVYTDNIVVGMPVQKYPIEELTNMIHKVGLYQYSLAVSGLFTRGAISLGPNYIGDVIVFGSALLDAHELESKRSVNGRIIFSKSCEELLLKELELGNSSFIKRSILKDADNLMYINYLNVARSYYSPSNETYNIKAFINSIERHKAILIGNLDAYRDKPAIFSKYVWQANYHNYFCNSEFPDLSNLNIDTNLLLPKPQTI